MLQVRKVDSYGMRQSGGYDALKLDENYHGHLGYDLKILPHWIKEDGEAFDFIEKPYSGASWYIGEKGNWHEVYVDFEKLVFEEAVYQRVRKFAMEGMGGDGLNLRSLITSIRVHPSIKDEQRMEVEVIKQGYDTITPWLPLLIKWKVWNNKAMEVRYNNPDLTFNWGQGGNEYKCLYPLRSKIVGFFTYEDRSKIDKFNVKEFILAHMEDIIYPKLD